MKSVEDRFWSKVDKTPGVGPWGDCWLWTGAKRRGYGLFWFNNRMRGAHCVSYMINKSKIPNGLWVLHSCDNPPCVNLAHLSVGTPQDDADQRDARGRTATGDRNGSRLHPEKMSRGEQHYSHTNPEKLARGEQVGSAKLREGQVLDIRMRYVAGGISQRTLAHEYGVTCPTIGYIIRRETWKHLKIE